MHEVHVDRTSIERGWRVVPGAVEFARQWHVRVNDDEHVNVRVNGGIAPRPGAEHDDRSQVIAECRVRSADDE